MEDREDAIWIAAEDGLYQYFPNGFKYIPSTLTPNPWTMLEDDQGAYWVASYGYLLKKIDGSGVTEVNVPIPFPPGANVDQFYFGSSKDRNGNLYFPHAAGFLQLQKGKWKNLFIDFSLNEKGLMKKVWRFLGRVNG